MDDKKLNELIEKQKNGTLKKEEVELLVKELTEEVKKMTLILNKINS